MILSKIPQNIFYFIPMCWCNCSDAHRARQYYFGLLDLIRKLVMASTSQ